MSTRLSTCLVSMFTIETVWPNGSEENACLLGESAQLLVVQIRNLNGFVLLSVGNLASAGT